jgi:drug/metabolite transporter (DMT)-like permease
VEPSQPSITKTRRLLLDLGLLYAAVVWGASFIVVKNALAGVHPVTMIGYRFLVSALLLAPWALRRPDRRRHLRDSLPLSGLLVALYVSQTWGLRFTTAANSGFITGLFVLFVPIILLVVFRCPPSRLQWVAVLLAVAGLWILTGGPRTMNRGDAMTLVAALCYAAHLLAIDRVVRRDADPVLLMFHQLWQTGLFCTALAAAAGFSLEIESPSVAGVIVLLAAVPTLSAFFAQIVAQRHTSPLKVSLIFSLEPVFAALVAWSVGGEPFRAASAIGGALIVCGMVFAEIGRPDAVDTAGAIR